MRLACRTLVYYPTFNAIFIRQTRGSNVTKASFRFGRPRRVGGALSRSAINFQAGAVSKLSVVFCALFVAVMVLLLGPFTRYIPKAALAGLLVVAAARLIDVERLLHRPSLAL
jgi:sulfate permease, SulP family